MPELIDFCKFIKNMQFEVEFLKGFNEQKEILDVKLTRVYSCYFQNVKAGTQSGLQMKFVGKRWIFSVTT